MAWDRQGDKTLKNPIGCICQAFKTLQIAVKWQSRHWVPMIHGRKSLFTKYKDRCYQDFFGRETANRKLQFAVKRWQFHIDRIPNFSRAFVVKCFQVIFGQVEVLHFYRLKNIKNIFIRVQKTHLHITGGCRNLSLAFKTLT